MARGKVGGERICSLWLMSLFGIGAKQWIILVKWYREVYKFGMYRAVDGFG